MSVLVNRASLVREDFKRDDVVTSGTVLDRFISDSHRMFMGGSNPPPFHSHIRVQHRFHPLQFFPPVLMASCFPDENTFVPEAPKLANAMGAA